MAATSTSAAIPDPAAPSPRDVTIATAGHVDHGKSTLIRVLTGTDPDRLPEERRREMTIELGFASIARPDRGRIAFIDVPGHDRLVEAMVAGVASVDAALLVVAADDGPMPQTTEHLRILRLLGIEQIIVAITRIDLVDGDWLDLAIASTRNLLDEHGFADSPVILVSAIAGAGIDELRDCLLAVSSRPRVSGENDPVWLPIDRVFHLHGHGTVVAGTLALGRLHRGDAVGIWPGGALSTVRQLQSHNQVVQTAFAGQRVAVNLSGVDLDQVRRGNVLSDRPIPAVETVDIWFESIGPKPRSGEVIRVMVGSDRVDAIIQLLSRPGAPDRDRCLARLRFRRPVATAAGDRLIIRRPSLAATIGGGVVLARYAGRPPRLAAEQRSDLAALAEGNPEPMLRRRLAVGPTTIESATADLSKSAVDILRRWIRDGTVRMITASLRVDELSPSRSLVTTEAAWLTFIRDLTGTLATHHSDAPESVGLHLTELRRRSRFSGSDFDALLDLAVREGHVVQHDGTAGLPGHQPRLRASEQPIADRLLLRLSGEQPIRVIRARDILETTIDFLERGGAIVRIGDDRIISNEQFDRFASWVIETSRSRPLDLSTVRDRIGIGRDDTQRLLERLDEMGLTVRPADGRRPGPNADEWLTKRRDRYIR